MPKQILKIDQFHGGLNSNSDPRDIAPNELSLATDIMVDELGRIRTMGGTATHGDAPANVAAIEPGYGLFQFSHDRHGAEQKVEHSGTHTGGDSATVLIDSAAAFTSGLVGGTVYNLTDGSSGTVASVDSGTQITVDDLLGGTSDTFDDSDNDAYIVSWPETGDDYLAMADADGAADIDIYSRVADAWGTSKIDLGSTTGMKPTFYAVDGALRVSDGNFGTGNSNQWYGYIKKNHFTGGKITADVAADNALGSYDGWYSKSLDLAKPTRGLYGEVVNFQDTTDASDVSEYAEYDTADNNMFNAIAAEINATYLLLDLNEFYVATDTGSDGDGDGIARGCRDTAGERFRTIDRNDAGGWTGHEVKIYPPTGKGWCIYCKQSSTAGSWSSGNYYLGITFLYIGNQESEIFELLYGPTVNRALVLEDGSAIDIAVHAQAPYDPFIIGGRAYIRKKDSDDSWTFLVDINLSEGVRTDLGSIYKDWLHDNSEDSQTTSSMQAPDAKYCFVGSINSTGTAGGDDLGFMIVTDPSAYTYEIINGYKPDDKIDIGGNGEGFKTAVVANRQAYIGNVNRENEEGEVVVQGDAMYKSVVNKFDTFPLANRIEVSVRDGDEIVKLEEYADRILQFKKKKMHLINISQELEFLEDTFIHKGVSHPAATCKTDFGIAWVNELGVYLYDGQKLSNLLERQGRQIIKEEEWDKFLRHDKSTTGTRLTPMIGYLPKKRQLIVFDDVTSTSTEDPRMYLYDIVTQSWVQGANDSTRIIDILKTNFVTDWNGDLVYAHTNDTGTVVKWDDTSDTTGTISFKTKDIDFGQPAQRKKIYKVYVSYKGDGRAVTINYTTDGDNDTYDGQFFRCNADGSTTGATVSDIPLYQGSVGTDDWINAELKPTASINNIYSFQLKFDGHTTDANFEINDISIIYRLKSIK